MDLRRTLDFSRITAGWGLIDHVNKLVEREAFLESVRIRSAELKDTLKCGFVLR